MAAPSLQEVLAAVPAVAELVNEMTELLPGCPASAQNLQTLWGHLQGLTQTNVNHSAGHLAVFKMLDKKKGKYQTIRVEVLGKPVDFRRHDGNFRLRPFICEETHPNTPEGLLACLIFARQSLYRYELEGACPSCSSAIGPVRKLKAVGMPRCAPCMLRGVISSEPPCKRARGSRD